MLIDIAGESELLTRILKDCSLLKSTSEGMRLIKQGAIKVDGKKIADDKYKLQKGTESLVQVGKKKIAQIIVN